MSAITPNVRLPRLEATGRIRFDRVLLSEWTKLRSVRSTKWSLGVGFLLTFAFPVIFAFATRSHWGSMSPQDRADRHPLDIALAGVNVAQLAIAVLGVLLVSAEYSTGSIRSSSAPRSRTARRCAVRRSGSVQRLRRHEDQSGNTGDFWGEILASTDSSILRCARTSS